MMRACRLLGHGLEAQFHSTRSRGCAIVAWNVQPRGTLLMSRVCCTRADLDHPPLCFPTSSTDHQYYSRPRIAQAEQ